MIKAMQDSVIDGLTSPKKFDDITNLDEYVAVFIPGGPVIDLKLDVTQDGIFRVAHSRDVNHDFSLPPAQHPEVGSTRERLSRTVVTRFRVLPDSVDDQSSQTRISAFRSVKEWSAPNSVPHFPFSTSCTYISTSLVAVFVGDVVTKMVALSLGIQTTCLATAPSRQSSGATAGTLTGTECADLTNTCVERLKQWELKSTLAKPSWMLGTGSRRERSRQ